VASLNVRGLTDGRPFARASLGSVRRSSTDRRVEDQKAASGDPPCSMDVSMVTEMSETGSWEMVMGIVRAQVHPATNALATSKTAGEVMPASGK